MDQRSRVARALHERLAAVGDDLGGLHELSALQRSLLERLVHIEAQVQAHESRVREGQPLDLQAYLALLDRLSRLATTLGLERRAKPVRRLADVIAAETAP